MKKKLFAIFVFACILGGIFLYYNFNANSNTTSNENQNVQRLNTNVQIDNSLANITRNRYAEVIF